MKVIVKQQPQAGWLSYGELLVGEVYYTTGGYMVAPTDDDLDDVLYLVTEDGGLVDLINGTLYPKNYGTNALKKWRYKKANVELVEYTNVSD